MPPSKVDKLDVIATIYEILLLSILPFATFVKNIPMLAPEQVLFLKIK